MSLTNGQKLHGFTVNRVRRVDELSANLVEMTHDKTGAQLVWVDNKENNKLFSVAFKTLPEDSTGVFHILEHSVLCGSEKFPVKEPFVELLKSSMNTFLNAITFPDKTMYPVSSRNDQDFMNLTEVYLDAVFAPAILHNPSIFHQEGWHLEMENENDTPVFKGVVFNEMKGAMSSVDEVIMEGMTAAAYPDTCYAYNSGGDPRVIPDLTYEQFISMYNRYYHPSNARIFLDGNVPLDRVLTLIDSYLSRYERSEEKHEIKMQVPFACEKTQYYEVSAQDGTENKAMLTLGKIIGTWQDVQRTYAAEILCDMLAGTNEAPLKRAVMSAGLCQDMDITVENSIAQPGMMLTVKNIDPDNAGKIRTLIKETCEDLLKKGLNKDALNACINVFEFHVREPHEPAGLMRNIMALNTWLHDGDPLLGIVFNDMLRGVREMVENGGFEQLMQELFLKEDDLVVLHTLPSTTLGEELRADEAARIKGITDKWTEEDKKQVLALNDKLHTWQKGADTPEQLATLPVLDLSEVSPEPALLHTEETTVDGVTVLYHKAATNGIVHLNYYFNLSDCTLDELAAVSGLSELLGVLPTAKHTATELQQIVKMHLGRLNFSLTVKSKYDQSSHCTPVLRVNCSVMQDKVDIAHDLITEILTSTDFTDHARIREVVLQSDENAKQMCIMAGNSLATIAACSHYSAAAAAFEALNGYTNVQKLHALAANFDEKAAEYAAFLQKKLAAAAVQSRLVLSITAVNMIDAKPLFAALPVGAAAPENASYQSPVGKQVGIRIPAQIGYAVMADSIADAGMEYHGSAAVASNILRFGYLWNVIRVQGGAYGTGITIGNDVVVCHSYRDPSPAKSLDSYRGCARFLREFMESGERLDKFIISTVARTEPLLSPRDEGARADGEWFSGKTEQVIRKEREEILGTTAEQLLTWCQALEHMAENGAVCIVAHNEALKAAEKENLTLAE